MTMNFRSGLTGFLLAGLLAQTPVVFAHAERTSFFPVDRLTKYAHPARKTNEKGQPVYRPLLPTPASPRLVVCKRPGNEGVESGQDSASRIAKIQDAALQRVNQQLLGECTYEHLQAAVDAVSVRGTTIYVLPGIYREQPSIRALEQNFGAAVPSDRDFCKAVVARGPGKLSYEEQFRCRFIQNTVAIFGDPDFTDDNCGESTEGVCSHPDTQACDPAKSACAYYDLQVEGTGEKITDVIFEGDFITKPGDPEDGHFRYLNGIRADRADGIYLRNFTTQIYEFNAVYVHETDGYVFDHLLSRWVDEYAFLSFASDHGLYDYTEGYGVADSVQYPGSGADIYKGKNHAEANLRQRQATEVRNSKGHHSALGYSGTAGNAPWVHDNEFYKNQTGMATESVYGGHPGMPQDHALWENNRIYSNNKDYYKLVATDGPCITKRPRDRGLVPVEFRIFDELPADFQEAIQDRTVVCPPIPFPTGTGMIIAGGDYDVVANNQVFDNWRQGLWLLSIPTVIHKITENPATAVGTQPGGLDAVLLPFFTAHYNRVMNNRFGENVLTPTLQAQANGVDIWWDNSGKGNCFVNNSSKQGKVTSDLGPLGVLGLPTDCADGSDPNTIEQVTTARPDRIPQFLNCLNYRRNDPASKQNCPFFTELVVPTGREGSTSVTSLRPTQSVLAAAGVTPLGYFVLHNESSTTHRLQTATLKASGPVTALGPLRLSVKDIRGNVAVAQGTLTGDTLTFSFSTPAEVPLLNATVFELTAGGTQTASSPAIQLASLPLGLGGAVLLLITGLRSRREKYLLLIAALLSVLLAGCGNSGSGGNGGGAPAAGAVRFELITLQFAGNPSDANYSGLPLAIGEVTLP